MFVLHRCNNPKCVNPNHLRLGTHLDNMQDRLEAGHYVKGRAHFNAKITEDIARAILRDTRREKDVAAAHGVSRHIVGSIRRREAWCHIENGLTNRATVC